MEFFIKKLYSNFEKLFFAGLSVGMLAMSVLLFMQYRYVQHEAENMLALKKEYEYYLLMMKKNIKDSSCSSEQDDESLEKKNDEEVSETESFLLVNRDPAYLQNSFQEFLDEAVEEDDGFQLVSAEDEKKLSLLRKQLAQRSTLKKKKVKKGHHNILKNLRKFVRKSPSREFTFYWPLELHHFWISSLYGPRKKPSGQVGFHYGVDMAALKGTPVKSAAAGVVVQAQYVPGYGNNILIQHNKNYRTRYAHLNSIGVKVHQKISAGQKIGTVGDTGFVRKNGHDASHLHFEIYKNGKHVNPLRYLFA